MKLLKQAEHMAATGFTFRPTIAFRSELDPHRGQQGPPAHPAAQEGPFPERLMLYGLLGSLPTVSAMLALSADPPPVGVNVTAIVHDEFGAAVPPMHVPPTVTAKSLAFVPLKLSLIGSENFDRLVTVTVLVFGDVLAVSVPYASVVGVTVAGIVGPVLSASV